VSPSGCGSLSAAPIVGQDSDLVVHSRTEQTRLESCPTGRIDKVGIWSRRQNRRDWNLVPQTEQTKLESRTTVRTNKIGSSKGNTAPRLPEGWRIELRCVPFQHAPLSARQVPGNRSLAYLRDKHCRPSIPQIGSIWCPASGSRATPRRIVRRRREPAD
jgi:hypothetical protein